jgi:hypothetical protein
MTLQLVFARLRICPKHALVGSKKYISVFTYDRLPSFEAIQAVVHAA